MIMSFDHLRHYLLTGEHNASVNKNMNIFSPYLAARDFIKAASKLPNKQKFSIMTWVIIAAVVMCFLNMLPAIMHEAAAPMHELPAIIRAVKEQPAKQLPADTTQYATLR
jgi:hypothetical protein